jgi:hypothetical protein
MSLITTSKITKTSSTPQLLIEAHVPSNVNQQSCIYVLGDSFLSHSTIFTGFFNCFVSVVCFAFH